ncbi:MAG: formylmethanofuran dehydrogenase subunit A [Methanosarcinales archaeon]|nr:formylmethanofuran dehydrogenase subunit A [ANME-2 cluster archaeon]MDF1532365.1 formylmethanofuran dehydrogenase subunit A [ANME-2 cluster archaeon]MDW7775813.1 formylmethanofuran dehydrogenase subunit A [Methanosarcinales archaeon]
MSEMLIKNATVYDPINSVNGDLMDVAVRNGKIVDSVGNSAQIIDAGGRLVYPGGVDAHTHIAGSKVNIGRIMRPEDSRLGIKARTKLTRPYTGYTVPNVYAMGYRYAEMGYTTAFEAAIPILKARHTHEELEEIPIIDKGGLTLFGSNWMVMDAIRENDQDRLAAYVAWGLLASRGWGVKIVNPGGGEAWGFGKNVSGLDDTVPNFEVTPRQIIRNLAEVNEKMNLPHSIHLHCNNLGKPGNYETTLASFDICKDIKASRDRQALHVTHVQFNSWGGNHWGDMESKSDAIADYLNKNDFLTIDMGQLIFGSATTMTADGPVQYANARLLKSRWSNGDVELEDTSGVTPLEYHAQNYVNGIMWAIGLELALLTKDPWQVLMTTDHPNGGPYVNYPQVMTLLMSKKKREEAMSKIAEKTFERTSIAGIDRELDWYDIAIKTRAAHAKVLGIVENGKGHLGVGADADIAIYDIKPDQTDATTEYNRVEAAFRRSAYTIKGGEIVAKNGEITATPRGRTFWVKTTVDNDGYGRMMDDLKFKFKNYYSVNMANYMVQDEYVEHPYVVETEYK